VFIVDAGHWTEEDALVLERVRESGLPTLLVVNKRTGDNCEVLEREILELLPEGEAIYPEDQVTDRPERFFAAELIREQITRRYHKELPYAVTVEIEEFDERPHIYRIGAVIWVERPNQKAILLGKGGQAMKETATEARKELESFFQKKVFLRLWVKVKKSWSSDQASLAQLGYTE